MKTAIAYSSTHHGNTKKLLDAIAAEYEVTLIDTNEVSAYDLTEYGCIGFASGITFSKYYESVSKFAENNLPTGKKVFFIYTCGNDKGGYTDGMRKIAEEKHSHIIGSYGCKGYDTYGPLKLLGGINKKNPTDSEIQGAVDFVKSFLTY